MSDDLEARLARLEKKIDALADQFEHHVNPPEPPPRSSLGPTRAFNFDPFAGMQSAPDMRADMAAAVDPSIMGGILADNYRELLGRREVKPESFGEPEE